VAIEFADDPNFSWHHRILLTKLDGGRWIVLTPDGDVEVEDLTAHRCIPLVRGKAVPARVAGDIYLLAAVSDADLRTAAAEATALAGILGAAVAVPVGLRADWIYSDPGHLSWGTIVPAALLCAAGQVVQRGSIGLVQTDPADMATWTSMERILPSDLEIWKDEKRNGPGRDPRVLPIHRDAQEHRHCSLRLAMQSMTIPASSAASSAASRPLGPPPASLGPDWIFRGPSAVAELLKGVRAAGEDLSGYHEYYCRASGLEPASAVGVKHRDILSVLHHMVTFDQLDAPFLASAELCARLVLQCQAAVKKNPKQPDFRGLQMMTMSDLDASGGVLTGDFARYVAEEQKSEAFTLKQQRLYADETTQSQKSKKGGDGGGK
jgi:hypothetical protein